MMHPHDTFWQAKTPTSHVRAAGILFKDAYIMCSHDKILPRADILIRNGAIAWIDPDGSTTKTRDWAEEVDASRFIIAPGLLNAHTHVALSYLRGFSHGHQQMVENLFFKTECELTPEILEPLSYSYIYDGLRAGVTFFGDHYYYIEGVAQALNRFGVRGVVGETIADLGGAFPDPTRWESAKRSIENWSYGPRVTPCVAPHAADTISQELLKDTASFAKSHNLTLHMHLSQSKGERDRVAKRLSMSPVAAAARTGALSEKTLAVHLVSADAQDFKILADHGVTVGFCPASQILFERLAPIKEFLNHELSIAVATDCAPSNDSCDVLAELKLTGLLARHQGCNEGDYELPKLFQMITENPAKVFGVNHLIGSLEAGKAADLVFIERDLISNPAGHPLSSLIYAAGSRNVRHVMVDGQWALWNQKSTMINEDDMQEQFTGAVREMFKRINMPEPM